MTGLRKMAGACTKSSQKTNQKIPGERRLWVLKCCKKVDSILKKVQRDHLINVSLVPVVIYLFDDTYLRFDHVFAWDTRDQALAPLCLYTRYMNREGGMRDRR